MQAAGVGRFTIADKTNYPAVDGPNFCRSLLRTINPWSAGIFCGRVFECSNPTRNVGCCIYFVTNPPGIALCEKKADPVGPLGDAYFHHLGVSHTDARRAMHGTCRAGVPIGWTG